MVDRIAEEAARACIVDGLRIRPVTSFEIVQEAAPVSDATDARDRDLVSAAVRGTSRAVMQH